jgi:hypothetical protein
MEAVARAVEVQGDLRPRPAGQHQTQPSGRVLHEQVQGVPRVGSDQDVDLVDQEHHGRAVRPPRQRGDGACGAIGRAGALRHDLQ